ncbi:lipopolysaccharide biosynthesis protein [Shewanella oncorhynchi]|uniref:lipopolysaccharide biosynthesis protein n=1 Tax=Shewanella TaxID=22 RepID=UPI00217EA7FE|nr:oligosaccharide flippase family protein [Shewanella baltica]MCS6153484.1 oligosaccharide flippase family protein [Shewanella baltica]
MNIKILSVKSNLLLAVTSKLLSLMASFVMIPILLKSLGIEKYGVWVTISSVAAWLVFFDFGLGNSFKNTVATCDKNKIKKEYSIAFSLYFYVSIILLILLSITVFLNENHNENQNAIIILYLPMFILFPLSLFSFGVQGLRLVGFNSLLDTFRIFLWLFFSMFYIFFIDGDELFVLSVIFVVSNILPQVAQFILFRSKCGFSLIPNIISPFLIIKDDSFRLGIRFFVIQLSSLISFNLGNVLIYNNFGPDDVAIYDVTNKVFVAALSVFNMAIAVMWPEITKAYSESNIKRCIKFYWVLLFFSFCFSVLLFLVYLKFEFILLLLNVNDEIIPNDNLIFTIMILTCLQSIAYCGAVVLNATNKLILQIYLALLSIIFIYPIFKLLITYDVGIVAYPLATGIFVLIAAISCNVISLRMLKAKYEY